MFYGHNTSGTADATGGRVSSSSASITITQTSWAEAPEFAACEELRPSDNNYRPPEDWPEPTPPVADAPPVLFAVPRPTQRRTATAVRNFRRAA
jgi:hypothetical protein